MTRPGAAADRRAPVARERARRPAGHVQSAHADAAFDFGSISILPPARESGAAAPAAAASAPQAAPEEPQPDLPALEEEAEAQAAEISAGRQIEAPVTPPEPPPGLPETPPAPPGATGGPGNPLAPPLRSRLERAFRASFADVRIHADPVAEAASSARAARAFTWGPHIAFAHGQYAPQTPRGLRLLAHELAHVVQQRRLGVAFVARDYGPPPPTSRVPQRTQVLREGLEVRHGAGWAEIWLGGRRWAAFGWDASAYDGELPITVATRETESTELGFHDIGLGLRVRTDVRVYATIDRTIEDNRLLYSYTLFSYDLAFPGELHAGSEASTLPYRVRELYTPTPNVEMRVPIRLNPPTAASLDPLAEQSPAPAPRPSRQEQQVEERRRDLIRGHPAFDTRAEMEAYIAAHPERSFIGISTSFGRFVARELDERELQRLADGVRSDLPIEEMGWDAEPRRSAWGVTGVYSRGARLADDALANLYYREDFFAGVGRGGEAAEGEVFRVGDHSYGRRPLTHEQALARWRELDAQTGTSIERLMTEPGRPFHALWVQGPGGMHEIGARYFRGRDAYRQQAAFFDQDSGNLASYVAGGRAGPDVSYFLAVELDREREDPTFRSSLTGHGELARSLGDFMYGRVRDRAQQIAVDTLNAGRDALAPLSTSADRMRQFVMGFPELPADRRSDALRYIGVPEDRREWVSGLLANRETAMQIALGVPQTRPRYRVIHDHPGPRITVTETETFTLDDLMGWAREIVSGIDAALGQLRAGTARALELEGDLGNHVRALVYREMGFRALDPAQFPHGNETEGFLPGPVDPGRFHFTTLGEQLYANHAKNLADRNFIWSILAVTGKVIAAVALILLAQEVGLAAAGLLFAEGSAAFVATEMIVSGVVYTALSEVETYVLEGHPASDSVGGFVGRSLLNIATFGAFRALNRLLAAGARSFMTARAGGEAAFTASRGAQVAAEALRITGVGASFLGLGLAQRLASGQGVPQGREMFLFLYENLLSIALLEGGAALARPMMEQTGIWARSQRLGALEEEVTSLRADVVRMQRDLAGLSVRPQSSAREAPGLVERQRALLERQRSLVERLRAGFRTRGDARQLEAQAGSEIELIDTALAGLAQAEFLSAERVMPVEGSESVFSYEPGAEAIARFRRYYGEDRVRVDADGTIRVEVPGLETRELVFVPSSSLTPAAPGSPPAAPALVQRQQALHARQQALLTRARLRGLTDPSLTAISRLRPLNQTQAATLDRTEAAIANAEAQAGARLTELTRNLLGNLRDRLGGRAALDQIRAGELSSVTDAELADVVWLARGLQNLGVPQFRALLFAMRPGEPAIDFPKLVATMRRGRFTVADRNFALETFMMFSEARIPGARQIMADMSQSTGHFAGGIYSLEYMRYVAGVENVAQIEMRVSVGSRDREYDVVLTDGTHIELKNWGGWEGRQVSSLLDEFDRDVLHLTSQFQNPTGLSQMRYVFRHPPPISVESIRSQLRTRLADLLERHNATPRARTEMLGAFDAHTSLVQSPQIQRSGGLALPPPAVSPPSPALPRRDDDRRGDVPDVPPGPLP